MNTLLQRLWKPWFVWRPRQLVLRAVRGCLPTASGYRPLRVAWGASLLADPTKAIGRCIWTTGIYDLAVSEVLARLIQPGETVIDGGANIGYMTLLAAAFAGPSGKVVAYEPHPELFAVLERNTESAAQVRLRQVAIGERAGEAQLVLPDTFGDNDGVAHLAGRADGGARSVTVEVTTLDAELGEETAAVLKLDVEGFELPVLKGAKRALESGRVRHIVFEDHQGRESEVVGLLRSHGYKVYSIGWTMRGPRVTPIASGEVNKDYEAPSYLASLDEEFVARRCSPRGWVVLSR